MAQIQSAYCPSFWYKINDPLQQKLAFLFFPFWHFRILYLREGQYISRILYLKEGQYIFRILYLRERQYALILGYWFRVHTIFHCNKGDCSIYPYFQLVCFPFSLLPKHKRELLGLTYSVRQLNNLRFLKDNIIVFCLVTMLYIQKLFKFHFNWAYLSRSGWYTQWSTLHVWTAWKEGWK